MFIDQVAREAFLKLPDKGWQVHTNLHFSHVQTHLVWAETTLPVEDYLTFFQDNPAQIGRIHFEDVSLPALIRKWRKLDLISPSDEKDFRREFGETRREYLNVTPGFQLSRAWPMSKVIDLEESDRLEVQLIDALREPLMTWQEKLPEWEAA